MTKVELVAAIAAKTGLTHREAGEFLEATLATIMDAVIDGDRVAISGFGNFLLIQRGPRKARNLRTGEAVEIAARKVPRFVPGRKFSDLAR